MCTISGLRALSDGGGTATLSHTLSSRAHRHSPLPAADRSRRSRDHVNWTGGMRVFVLCAVLTVAGVFGDSAVKEAVVRDLFRKMLHIQPPSGSKLISRPATPRHMLELYQQFSRKQSTDGATTTIRNLLPLSTPWGVVGSKDILFNVSCVQGMEEVRLAQLQLNRRKLHQRHQHKRLLAPPYRIRLYQATPSRLVPLTSLPVSMVQRSSWESVDISVALKELLSDPRSSRRLLAVRFESPSGKPIPPSHFLRGVPDTPNAFLVVFTEDSEENRVSQDGSQPAPRPPVHTHALVQKLQQGPHSALFLGEEEVDNNSQLIPVLSEVKRTRIFTRNNTKTVKAFPTTPPSDNSGELIRRVRSILDNQLPYDDDLEQHAKQLKSRRLRPDLLVPKVVSKKGKKIKKCKKKKISEPQWNKNNQVTAPGPAPEAEAGSCSLRKLTVEFSELGWSHFIVAPDKFDANYCTGTCHGFPLTEPTNHATVQSLIHLMGRYPLVPAPACVPQQMSSIALLYIDENGNVVLKNYNNMIVKTCGCR